MSPSIEATFRLSGRRHCRAHVCSVHQGRLYVSFTYDHGSLFASTLLCLEPRELSVLWERFYPHIINSLAASGDGTLVCTHMDGLVAALDPHTGNVQWEYRTEAPQITAGSDVRDGRLVIGSLGGGDQTYCLDARTGRLSWQIAQGGHAYPATIAPPYVFQAGGHHLRCLEVQTGSVRWVAEEPSTYLFTASAREGLVVIGGHGILNVYAVADGRLLTQANVERPDRGAIRFITWADDHLFFAASTQRYDEGAGEGVVYCYRLDPTGPQLTQVWQRGVGGAVDAPLSVGDGEVWVVSKDAKVTLLDAATGEQRWQRGTKGAGGMAPVAAAEDSVFVAVGKGHVFRVAR